MRVRHVSVSGLFGVFDHEIPLQEESRITILHGLNGIGKTITLQMIAEALTGKYDVLLEVPYKRFELRFDDGSTLRAERADAEVQRVLRFTRLLPNGREEVSRTECYGNPETGGYNPHTEEWLVELRRSVDVCFLETTRLINVERVRAFHEDGTADDTERSSRTIQELSRHLMSLIEARRSDYLEMAQELAQSFPLRILARNGSPSLSAEDVHRKLEDLRARHDGLHALGILSPSADMVEDVPEGIDASTLRTLSVYVHDTERKLALFDELTARIGVLLELVNKRFWDKRLTVRRDKGFVVTTADGGDLPVARLSTGEQHQIVMLYDLLFKTKPDTLVLIDEPEISLQVVWAQEFLDDVEKIVRLVGIDIIVATHSPDIAGHHWDWTVALKRPGEE